MDGEKAKDKKAEIEERLAAKRAANEAVEAARSEAAEVEDLERQLAIEEKRAESYDAGLSPGQLLELSWPELGRCLVRTPSDDVYREFVHRSGMLRGQLTSSVEVHEKLALNCALVPEGKTFLALAKRRNPHALLQLSQVVIQQMGLSVRPLNVSEAKAE